MRSFTSEVSELTPIYASEHSGVKVYLVPNHTSYPFPIVIKQYTCLDQGSIDQVINEARISLKYDHKHICKSIDMAIEEQVGFTFVYIMMKAMPKTLFDSIQEKAELAAFGNSLFPEDQLWKYLRSLVSAFAFLQKHNIAHRDIKPMNILIDWEGELLVCDFGFAKKSEKSAKQLHTLLGTNYFCSPILKGALISGNKDMNKVIHNLFKSDVYSLGMTMLLASSLELVEKLTNLQQLQATINESINNLHKAYSESWRDILRWLLEVNEGMRPDFLTLEEYLNFADDEEISVKKEQESNSSLFVELNYGLSCIRVSTQLQEDVPCMITVRGMQQDSSLRPNTMDLVCVVDQSGSMSGRPLELVQVALTQIVNLLGDRDRVCVVGFSDEAHRKCPLTACTSEGKRTILGSIETLEAWDASNVIAGVDLALQVVRQRRMRNSEVTVLIFTDGGHNCEGDAKGVCGDMLRHCGIDNMTVQCIAMGTEINVCLLEALATEGKYHILNSSEAIDSVIQSIFWNLASAVVRDIHISISPIPDSRIPVSISKVYSKGQSSSSFHISALSVDEEAILVFRLRPDFKQINKSVCFSPLVMKVTYIDVNGVAADQEIKPGVKFVPWGNAKPLEIANVSTAWFQTKGCAFLLQARELADAGDFQAAMVYLKQGIEQIASSEYSAEVPVATVLSDMERAHTFLSRPDEWLTVGRAGFASKLYKHFALE